MDVFFEDDVLTLRISAADFVLVHKGADAYGLGSTQPLPMGTNIGFFKVTFTQDTAMMNIVRDPVTFLKRA